MHSRPISLLTTARLFLLFTTYFGLAAPSAKDEKGRSSGYPVRRDEENPLKIAIIGAGAGGSSAAFFLGMAKDRFGHHINIDLFERNSYIGGRSTAVHPYGDPSLPPQELGASIFIDANKNLIRAASEFGLSLISPSQRGFNVWNGTQFVISINGAPTDTNLAAKYGQSSLGTVADEVRDFVSQVNRLYTPSLFSWKTVQSLSKSLKFTSSVSQTAAQFFDGLGVNTLYTREFIDSVTRVNYGQNVDKIHALAAEVSVAPGRARAYSVAGGNGQIFQQFANRSSATVRLDTPITSLTKYELGNDTKWLVAGNSKELQQDVQFGLYDYVILAAPNGLSGINFINSTAEFPDVPYVRLSVTLVSTTSPFPQRSFFEPGGSSTIGLNSIMTTTPVTDFNSIDQWATITRNGQTEYIYKTFTLEPKSDEWLQKLFGQGTIGWTYRYDWDAYPYMTPRDSFPPIKPDDKLFYVNSFEPLISTMETEILSARNVVDLLLKEEFDRGLCFGDDIPEWASQDTKFKIYGWDCS
ncbi:hypothetical protein FRC02_011729 [Tulasnella sp. 418]|nr:hypothetical protein FRC02_011729 [Tulasnella sp. 418]